MQYVAVLLLHNTANHYQALYQKFRILAQVVAEKSLTETNVRMYYIRVKEGKKEKWKKEGQMRISILISTYSVHFAFLKVYTKF